MDGVLGISQHSCSEFTNPIYRGIIHKANLDNDDKRLEVYVEILLCRYAI
jgi:hypothetical protein